MASRVRLPSISFMVARSYPGNVIGYKHTIPWHVKSDLKRFREITIQHAIIMGRSTYNSIGRALPKRANIVMTRDHKTLNTSVIHYDNETQIYFANTMEDALFAADIISICLEQEDIFIIGGETIYSLFDELVNRVYLTEVFGDFSGDAFFKKAFPSKKWITLKEEDYSKNYVGDEFGHRFSILQRRERRYRYEFVSKFFTERLQKSEWLKSQVKSHKRNVDKYIENHLELNLAP